MISEASHLPGWSRRHFVRAGAGALAAPLFLGCGNSSTGPDSGDPPPVGDPRLTARPGQPVASPTIGRSQLDLGGVRDGFLYVPTSYTPDTPMPLLVAMHGAGGGAHEWSLYDAAAESRGMIVLAPDSRAATWDLSLGAFGADVAFLDDALAYTFERCRIDPTHLALGGFSDGASYALSLGVSNGDLFSHLIAYSPGFYLPSTPIVGRPPVFVSHGTEDLILSVARSRDVIVPQLRGAGYDVEYQEFIGGHLLPAAISDNSLAWFLGTS
jgi:phospholipase/carboxylesterase